VLRRILDSPWTYFGLAAVLLVVAVLSQFDLQVPSRPKGTAEDLVTLKERDDLNVVFIVIDTLRADHLGSYGYERDTSPVMDRLVDHGIRFDRVESQSSWTKCSMASLWTGVFPPRTGVTRFHHAVPEAARLPAEIFLEAGYQTAGLWRNGWVAPNFGFGRGFQNYFRAQDTQIAARDLEAHRPGQTIGGTDEDITQAAREYLRTYGREKFFLYLHYMDAHQFAYDQAAADLAFGTGHMDAYDGAIHWTDRNVGWVLAELEELDLFKKTLVAIVSDHGEAFFEHGGEGHARNLYREVTEVPWMIIPPFIMDEGVVVEPLVRNVDIWPTLLELVGLPGLPGADGKSVLPMILAAARGEEVRAPEPAISFLDQNWGRTDAEPNPLISVRRNGKRLLLHPEKGAVEAYDTAVDPAEQQNLAGGDSPPEWIAEMVEEGRGWYELEPAWGAAPEVVIEEMYKEQLKALGYVVK
jgi:arylsulfatase A-like enzyme